MTCKHSVDLWQLGNKVSEVLVPHETSHLYLSLVRFVSLSSALLWLVKNSAQRNVFPVVLWLPAVTWSHILNVSFCLPMTISVLCWSHSSASSSLIWKQVLFLFFFSWKIILWTFVLSAGTVVQKQGHWEQTCRLVRLHGEDGDGWRL